MKFKKLISVILCFAMLAAFSGCSEKQEESASAAEPKPQYVGIEIKLGILRSDYSIPVAKLMNDTEKKLGANKYMVNIYSDENEVLNAITSESVDVAMLPLKTAAEFYNSQKGINMLNIGTSSGIWIVENGATISELSELKDKKIGVVGQKSREDNLLRFVLRMNRINPDEGITFEYFENEQQLSTAVSENKVDAAIMPQLWAVRADEAYPEATINRRINLCDEWLTVRNTEFPEYCYVVRKDFAAQHPSAVKKFNEELKNAAKYCSSNKIDASELCEKYNILSAAQAEECLKKGAPSVIKGGYMKKAATGYYSMMLSFDYTLMGGRQPNEEFYFK